MVGGDGQLGGVDVVPFLAAIVGCHWMCYGWGGWRPTWGSGRCAMSGCHRRVPLNVLWLGGRVTTNLGEWTWLLGAIECAMVVGESDGQLWGSGRGAIARCHCSVLWLGGGWRPILKKITWCHCRVPSQGAEKKLPWASCRCCVVLYIDNTKIGLCYLGSMLV